MYDAWWKSGVGYQIYPRSFADQNDDGMGDLPGITAKLDYLEWLGIDLLWLSPIFRSPMADFGYDVSDYCDVDPLFGTLADLDLLLAEAHKREIRVLLDFVPNHTSDSHPWFVESRKSRDSSKRNWYWWRDPKPDGSPPNNWLSNFIGPAWTLDKATGQYYLHLFLPEQPDLNWANAEVESAMHSVLRFWFERGVDGFRIDVVHGMAKDALLRDNPPNPDPRTRMRRPLLPVYSQDQPEVHDIIRGLRRVFDEYSAVSVGEVYLMDTERISQFYGNGTDELHLAFNFRFLWSPWRAASFCKRVEEVERCLPPSAWPTYTLSNHDHSRHATRYGASSVPAAALMLLALRGTPFLYYGEELGMPDVPLASGHDPVGRDPERTPMRWDPSPNGGFSRSRPWLPLCPTEYNVEGQASDDDSTLSLYRRLIALRKATPALSSGDYATLPSPDSVFAWRRGHEVDVAINMGDEPVGFALTGTVIGATDRSREGETLRGKVPLAPNEGVVVQL